MTVALFNFLAPYPVSRPVLLPSENQGFLNTTLSVQRLPTETIGVFTLTLTNVVVGSRVHVEKQSDGTSFYDAIAVTSTVAISLSAYSAGSAYNDLRIKVRKGSTTPKYLPFETFATAVVGSVSVYVAQVPDTIAS